MIHVKHPVKGIEVPIEYFTKDEAIQLGLSFVPWRQATKDKEWVLSDDGYVLKTVRVKYITELQPGGKTPRVRRRVITGLAVRYPHGKRPMNIKEHIKAKSYGLLPEPWYVAFDKQEPAIRKLLAELVLTGKLSMDEGRRYTRREYGHIVELAKRIFGEDQFAWMRIRTYFGNEEVRKMIRVDIMQLAKERNFTVERVFELLEKAITFGEAKADGKVLIAVAKEMASIVNMPHTNKATRMGGLPPPPDEDKPMLDAHYDQMIEEAEIIPDENT